MIFPCDIDSASQDWGANCGPCSIAAILNKQVQDIRPFLGDFEKRHYMNMTHLKESLSSAGATWRAVGANLPEHGLAFIQWGGHEKRPVRVQYTFTHTIAIDGHMVFEVNAHRLVTWDEWRHVMPREMQKEGLGDGTFFVRGGIEVSRAEEGATL